jgi:hypothetical protein
MSPAQQADKKKTVTGKYRKQLGKLVGWARNQYPSCTSDTQKARLLDHMMKRVQEIRLEMNIDLPSREDHPS